MTDDDADASARATCTFTTDELNIQGLRLPDTGCSRPVWEGADAPRCVWHADGADKPPEELAATVGGGELFGARARGSDLTAVSFPEDSRLAGADFAGADLNRVDLTGANLFGADLADATLWRADLTDANLSDADLTGADLLDADLTGANLFGADLAGANLVNTDLRNALLAETTLADVSLARDTIIGDPADQIKEANLNFSSSGIYDAIARTNHELSAVYSDNGLTGRARRARVREHTARRKAALAEESWRGSVAWAGSVLSKTVTGYGVQLSWIAMMMLLLYLMSAGVYWSEGMALDRALYYSVVTFTTSPPETPPPGIATVVAGIETFGGTFMVVALGAVLGNRVQA